MNLADLKWTGLAEGNRGGTQGRGKRSQDITTADGLVFAIWYDIGIEPGSYSIFTVHRELWSQRSIQYENLEPLMAQAVLYHLLENKSPAETPVKP